MPRTARLAVPGCPHHIVRRGNNGRQVFSVDEDRRYDLKLLRGQAERFGLAVQACCLMTNQLYLIATPRAQDSPTKGDGRTNLYSTRYVNGLPGRSGHLWQGRFSSSSLDEEWFWNALIYVERKAVRAKRAATADDRRQTTDDRRQTAGLPAVACGEGGSSAAAHGGGRDGNRQPSQCVGSAVSRSVYRALSLPSPS